MYNHDSWIAIENICCSNISKHVRGIGVMIERHDDFIAFGGDYHVEI